MSWQILRNSVHRQAWKVQRGIKNIEKKKWFEYLLLRNKRSTVVTSSLRRKTVYDYTNPTCSVSLKSETRGGGDNTVWIWREDDPHAPGKHCPPLDSQSVKTQPPHGHTHTSFPTEDNSNKPQEKDETPTRVQVPVTDCLSWVSE